VLLLLKKISNKQLNFFIALLALIVFSIGIKYRIIDNTNEKLRFIDGDGKGYYAYLPAVLIHHDLSFSFYEKDTVNFGYNYSNTFVMSQNGINVNKYTCGEAALLLPFFLLAMLWSFIFHMPMDGYNQAFQVFCVIGSFFYLVLGMIFTKKFLQQYNISNIAITFGLISLALGTNLLNYTINENSMSHIFSFAIIAWHAFTIKKYSNIYSIKGNVLMGITLGLLILIRPVNAIIVLAYPFLWNKDLLSFFKKDTIRKLITIAFCAFCVAFVQLIVWKIETGHFLVYSYKNEGFYFNKPPHFFEYLFGFRRGAFIYSPILFFTLVGLFFLWKRNLKEFLALFLFLILLIYIHASWWSWYYGDGFGERPLVDFYVFFALLIAIAFNDIKNFILKISSFILLFAAVGLHQLFFYQYYYYIIHPESMNLEKFKYIFFKTDEKYRLAFKCGPEDFYYPKGIHVVDSAKIDFTKNDQQSRFMYDKNNKQLDGYNLKKDNYQPQIIFTTDTTWFNKARFVEFYIDYTEPKNDTAASDILFVVECLDSLDKTKWFNTWSVLAEKYNFVPNKYNHAFERLKIGTSKKKGDRIKVYIFNPHNRELIIKQLAIKIVEASN
jgi:hypothetical protein